MTSKEALVDIKKRNEALKKEGHFHIGETTMKIIEQLVERDTPMKPLKYAYGGYQCQTCGGLSVQSHDYYGSEINLNFCNDCGQRLDWS